VAGRQVEIGAARLARWCAGFGERHGEPVAVTRDGGALRLSAPDGATASLLPPFALPDAVTDITGLLGWTMADRRCAVLLVRRGGYACACVELSAGHGTITATKVGTRHVQSRTAAGGWSQQRFARRRDNQARELVGAVADVAARLLVLPGERPGAGWLVTGGDRPLVDAVLADPRLRPLAGLPRGVHLAVGDPRSNTVKALPEMLTVVRIALTDPPSPGGDLPEHPRRGRQRRG
jgi:hypothetical protein